MSIRLVSLHTREMLAKSHGQVVVIRAPISDINGLNIISTKACSTHRTLAVTTFGDFLYTRVAEEVVAFCNNNLKGQTTYKQFR